MFNNLNCYLTPSIAHPPTKALLHLEQFISLNTTFLTNEDGSVFVYSDPDKSCKGYAGTDIGLSADAKWKTAKAFSIIAVFIGGVVMFLSCSALAHPKLWKAISVMLLITTLSQGLTLLFLTSNECYYPEFITNTNHYSSGSLTMPHGCSLASGGKMALSATVMWFVSALAAIFTGGNGAPEIHSKVAEDKKEPKSEEALEAGR